MAELDLEEVEEPAEVDKSKLEAAVSAAKELEASDYTEASWTAYAKAIEAAEAVLANEEATQAEVDEALKALTMAELDLEEVEEPAEVDKENNNNTSSQGGKNNTNNKTDAQNGKVSSGKNLPKTGEENSVLLTIVGILLLLVYLYVRRNKKSEN